MFNPTGAVNGTYQITPHYAATGTVTKADTALNSFNVSVSGQPVQQIAPFLVSTVYHNDQSFGSLYAYKNGVLESVMSVSENEGYGPYFANINNTPVYLAEIFDLNGGYSTSYKYSNDGYTWKSGNVFNCNSGESWYVEGYAEHTPNAILGICVNQSSGFELVSKIYSTPNGKDWNLIWQSSEGTSLPVGVSDIYKTQNQYFAYEHTSESIALYKLSNSSWVNQNMDTSSFSQCSSINTPVTNGVNFIITCDHTAYISNDLGKTWTATYSNSDVFDIGYYPYLNQYYDISGYFYSNTGEINTWVRTMPTNINDGGIWGYNPQIGYIGSNSNNIYIASNLQNGQLNFQQKFNISTISSNPNLRIDNLVVGY